MIIYVQNIFNIKGHILGKTQLYKIKFFILCWSHITWPFTSLRTYNVTGEEMFRAPEKKSRSVFTISPQFTTSCVVPVHLFRKPHHSARWPPPWMRVQSIVCVGRAGGGITWLPVLLNLWVDEIHVNRMLTQAGDWTTVGVVSSHHRNEKKLS